MSNPFNETRELRFTDFTGGIDNCLDYATHTDSSDPYYAPVGSRAEVWKDGKVYKYLVEDIGAEPDGYNVIKSARDGYAGTLRWTLYGVSSGGTGCGFAFPNTAYEPGLSDEEIFSIQLGQGEKIKLRRIGVQLDGGGTDPDFTVEVYDATAASSLGATPSTLTGDPIAESQTGSRIAVRVSNASAGTISAGIYIEWEIV